MTETRLKYQSGEEIRKGDRVLFHGEPGEIELVVDDTGDEEKDWHMKNQGPGIMVREQKVFGRAYLNQPENAEDLVFVSRAGPLST